MSGTALPAGTTASTTAQPAWLPYFASKQPAPGTPISRGHRLALVRLYIAFLNVENGADHSVDAGQPAPVTTTTAPAATDPNASGSGSNAGATGTDPNAAPTS